jgi:hypothetical protein
MVKDATFGIDTEIRLLGRRSAATTIRREYERNRVALRKDSSRWMAVVERDDGQTVSVAISEADFKSLGGS